MSADFKSLRDRNHSEAAKREFVERLKGHLTCGFENFDRSVVMARSNLDFKRLSDNFLLLDFDVTPFQLNRLRIDKELVGWRHGVAHGDSPDLRTVNVVAHIDFASELLLKISDSFQISVLNRI